MAKKYWSVTEVVEFFQVNETFLNDLEKEDIVIPWAHQYVRKSNRIIQPIGESRHEIKIMTDIAARLGLKETWLFQEPWQALKKAFENALENGDFQDLTAGKTVKLKFKPIDDYPTDSGQIAFYSKDAETRGYHPLPKPHPVNLNKEEYVLLNSSIQEYLHTQFQEVYGPIPAIVWMNPHDADSLGVKSNQPVTLYNEFGETRVKVAITERVPSRVLWSPKELIGLDNNPQNGLTKSTPQHVGGGAIFNSTTVNIKVV